MEARASNPSTQEAEAGGLWVKGQPGLHSEFEASQCYIARPCLKKKKVCVCVCVYHIEYIVQKWSYKNAKKFFQNKE
jgi:hypothetical protein